MKFTNQKITQKTMIRYALSGCMCFLMTLQFVLAQQQPKQIDSLLKVLPTLEADSQKVIVLNKLAMAYLPTFPHKSSEYAQEAQKIAQDIDFQLGLGKSMQILGEASTKNGQPTQALEYYWKALEIFEKLEVPQELAITLFEIGEIYQQKQEFANARKYYFRLQDMSDKLRNDRTVSIRAIENIAKTFELEGNYSQALYYIFQALNANRRFKNIKDINRNLGDIGEIYYLEKEYKRAEEYLKNALEMARDTKDTTLTALNLQRLAELALLQQNLGQAEQFALESMEYAQKLNNKLQIRNTAKTLSNIYKEKNDFVKGFDYLSVYLTYKDSLEQEANLRELEGLRQAYESKQQQAKTLEQNLAQKAMWQGYLVVFIFGIVLIGSVVLMLVWIRSQNKVKQKENILQDHKLSLEEQSAKLKKAEATLSQKQKDSKENVQYALQAQKILQMSATPLRDVLPEHFLFYQPKNTLNGDFYWLKSDMHKFYIALGDCTGQGVTAALQTMTVSNLLSHILTQDPDQSPEKILKTLNQYQHEANTYPQHLPLSQRKYMGLGICRIDRTQKILTFAGAKNTLYYWQEGRLQQLKGDKVPIGGGTEEHTFHLCQVPLQDDATIYLCSDGFQNQFGGNEGKKFMGERFRNLIKEVVHLPMAEQAEKFRNTFTNWHSPHYKQIDDVLIVGFRWKV